MQAQLLLAFASVLPITLPAFADTVLDHRASFPEVKPYSGQVSQPVIKPYSFPRPGRYRVTVNYGPWYRVANEQFRSRSTVPIDGRDFGGWVEFIPGATMVSSRGVPDPRVDGAGLVIVYEITVRQAQPGMQSAIYPPVVRFGDGSAHQLPSSASVIIESIPERDDSGLASPHAPVSSRPGTSSHWACTGRTYGFRKSSEQVWDEITDNGSVRYHMKEVARTSDYVEMLDEQRRVWVRIFRDHFAWSNNRTQWVNECNGAWMESSGGRVETSPPNPANHRPGPSSHWTCTGRTYGFRKSGEQTWSEITDNGSVRYHMKEIARTSEYVEILDEQRRVWVRIFHDHFAWSDNRSQWVNECNGAWVR